MLVINEYADWVGKEQVRSDVMALNPVRCMHALLDRSQPEPKAGDPLPWGWHWLWMFNLSPAPQAQIDLDGHPRRGDFLPPVGLPRRMWAGSRIRYTTTPLRVGQEFACRSRIRAVQTKEGRSGTLVFVTVEHQWTGQDGMAILEEQDIVYRELAQVGALPVQPQVMGERTAVYRQVVDPSPTWLFRYSALTFNAHRIHYDRGYACDVEGYPGLVVHGPLQATLLQELLSRHRAGRDLEHFEFRGVAPLCDTGPMSVCAGATESAEVPLWTESAQGDVATQALARWR